MKCIRHRKTGQIARVPNEIAAGAVLSTEWHYTTKSKFRSLQRRMRKARR